MLPPYFPYLVSLIPTYKICQVSFVVFVMRLCIPVTIILQINYYFLDMSMVVRVKRGNILFLPLHNMTENKRVLLRKKLNKRFDRIPYLHQAKKKIVQKYGCFCPNPRNGGTSLCYLDVIPRVKKYTLWRVSIWSAMMFFLKRKRYPWYTGM